MLAAGAMLACSTASPAGPEPVTSASAAGSPSVVTTTLVDLTNAERVRAGIAALRADPRLMEAAQIQADQMAHLQRLDNVLLDALYPHPEDRLAAVAYSWHAFAENVAYGQRGPAEAIVSWMQSTGHRTNMMNSAYTEIGTGLGTDAAGRPYYVQVFGHP